MEVKLRRPASRRLPPNELAELLELDVPAHLATITREGFPRVTPIWFLWESGSFYITSLPMRRHIEDLQSNGRAGLCIDTEESLSVDGVRPNRQVTVQGRVDLLEDKGGYWTRRITRKYIHGPEGDRAGERRASMPRVAIVLHPVRLQAIGTLELPFSKPDSTR